MPNIFWTPLEQQNGLNILINPFPQPNGSNIFTDMGTGISNWWNGMSTSEQVGVVVVGLLVVAIVIVGFFFPPAWAALAGA